MLFFPLMLGAQNQLPDSVLQMLKGKSSQQQADLLAEYGNAIYQKSRENATVAFDTALAISTATNYLPGKAKAKKGKGLLLYYSGKYEGALSLLLEAISDYDKAQDADGKADLFNDIANMMRKHGDADQAEVYLRKALAIYQQTNNLNGLANTNNNLGIVFETKGNLDSAMIHYQKGLELYEKADDEIGMSYSLDYVGLIHAYRSEFKESETFLLRALAIREKRGEQFAISTSLVNLGEVYMAMNETEKAITYFNKSLRMADSLKFPDLQSYNYKMLAEANSRKSNYKTAFDFYKRHITLQDSLFNLNRNKQLTEMQTKYETAEKEKENANLLRENQLKELNISNKNNQLLLLSGMLILALSAGMLYFNRQKLVRQKLLNEEIQKQQELRLKAVIASQEEERNRIAAELHDGLGQSLASVRMRLSREPISTESLDALDKSCVELREISHNLMPSNLMRSGLVTALLELSDRINKSGKLNLVVDSDPGLPPFSPNAAIQVFRIIQELLTNIIKYADATEATIQLMADDQMYSVMVEDNGKGFDKNELQTTSGNGWYNIQSRLTILNGAVEIDSAPGRGTVVTIDIPLS
ncbi:MAG: sensor histidine kinase [Bacteroidetes bacterium]|nr:sensor histidine kinase [Bacteroidota bacterium]